MEQGAGATFAGGTATSQTLPGPPGLTDEIPKDEQGNILEPGTGPLPPGAQDGFDPNVLLDPATGKVVYKTKEQKSATKTRSIGPPGMLRIYTDGSALKNGRDTAAAGVGVFFGPGDTRFVLTILHSFYAKLQWPGTSADTPSSQQKRLRATKRQPAD
jgi:ribonuclease HI